MNENELKQREKDSLLWLIIMVAIALTLALTAGVSVANAQRYSHCEKEKLFIGEMKIDMFSFDQAITPSVSVGLGVSGVYGKGTILDNFGAIVGVRAAKETQPDKSNTERLVMIPTATLLYRLRLNGAESTTIHGFAVVAGENRKYLSFEYRPYVAPTGNSFATIGGLFGWNNVTGYTVGFTVLGFF